MRKVTATSKTIISTTLLLLQQMSLSKSCTSLLVKCHYSSVSRVLSRPWIPQQQQQQSLTTRTSGSFKKQKMKCNNSTNRLPIFLPTTFFHHEQQLQYCSKQQSPQEPDSFVIKRSLEADGDNDKASYRSVSGIVYTDQIPHEQDNKKEQGQQHHRMNTVVVVTLFTRYGCTLCDQVKEVLQSIRKEHPHTLQSIDITDDEHAHWFAKYKYDIPVLHINNFYWTKHRLSKEVAIDALTIAQCGGFTMDQIGEPNADAMKRGKKSVAEEEEEKVTKD